MSNIAIIPARGGSKRIPQKNIQLFMGKPMIAYSIEAAISCNVFDDIVVSTDDDAISEVARSYGATVPFIRPAALSDDYIGLNEVMKHAVEESQKKYHNLQAVCCILATAPFIRSEEIIEGLSILEKQDWKYVFSATSFSFPIFRAFTKQDDLGLSMFFPEHFSSRSQDLPEAMHDAGQFYWAKPLTWIEQVRVYEKWSTVIELPRWRVQDIDTMEDWKRAEIIATLI